MSAAISVRGVSKRFSLGKEKYDSLKDRVIHLGRTTPHDFWALRDISLDIEEGSTVGLLGHNGSGKSTLLKCIAGILQPTSGDIVTRGRMSALLELGAGFHGDLTGRENVEMNGLLLGLSRREIARRFDEIIEFAGEQVEQHIDQQVKFYSSGMFVRLGFAIAVNIDPDILLIDEVLAVGDEAFQRKCLAKVKEFQDAGKTIVFVTHGADMVRQICDRAAVLDHGVMVCHDNPGVAIRTFREHLFATGRAHEATGVADPGAEVGDAAADPPTEADRHESGAPSAPVKTIEILDVRAERDGVRVTGPITPGTPLDICIAFKAAKDVDDVNFGMGIIDERGEMVWGSNTRRLKRRFDVRAGEGVLRWRIERMALLDGAYELRAAAQDRSESLVYDWVDAVAGFEVVQTQDVIGTVALDVEVRLDEVGDLTPSA